jgi:glycosyltransferase involved in cell wall biosynthesis
MLRSPIALSPLDPHPLVSVLLTSYNYARYVAAAIESVREQSYDRFEVIVCDDGSSDDSCDVIRGQVDRDSRVHLIRKANGGCASALNRAFAESHGAVLCLLDADDLWEHKKLGRVVTAFQEHADCGLVTHPLKIIDSQGRGRGEFHCAEGGLLGDEIATLRMGHLMPVSSGLSFHRTVLEAVLPLPEAQFRSSADHAVAFAAATLTRTVRVSELLGSYRVHGENLTGTTLTAERLDVELLRKMLSAAERCVDFADEFSRAHLGRPVPASRTRNVLEHRIMLSLLTGDSALLRKSREDLSHAYEEVRRDYPAMRYRFWEALTTLPQPVARAILLGAFRLLRLKARLMAGPQNPRPEDAMGLRHLE